MGKKVNRNMKILAGIVLYNPDIHRLKENIEGIYNQVDKLIFIDNNSSNKKEILKLLEKYNNIEIIHNEKNNGIAGALNQILEYANKNNYEWFLTLDQDSVAQNKLISNYSKVFEIENVGMITCNIIDRNFIEEKKDGNEYSYINRCITSGCINNTEVIQKCGGFDNKMFIDYVDFDICATLIENNYKIIKINYDGLLHEVGHAKIVKFFGKKEKIFNHSPFRTYYIIRNRLYFLEKHNVKKKLKEKMKILKRCILILVYQNNKKENLYAILRGYIDSKKMKG